MPTLKPQNQDAKLVIGTVEICIKHANAVLHGVLVCQLSQLCISTYGAVISADQLSLSFST